MSKKDRLHTYLTSSLCMHAHMLDAVANVPIYVNSKRLDGLGHAGTRGNIR